MTIALTIGDCNGIGPECGLKALHHLCTTEKELLSKNNVLLAIISGRVTLEYWVELHNSQVGFPQFELRDTTLWCEGVGIQWIEIDSQTAPVPGLCTKESGEQAKLALERSLAGLQQAEFDAVVTLPVNKFALQAAGFGFPGQTEFYSQGDSDNDGIMMLMGEKLRVALATVHVPLNQVASLITAGTIEKCLLSLGATMREDFAINSPRVAVLGLNPHAGEQGLMGHEETHIKAGMLRAQQHAETAGTSLRIDGPFPADGFFARKTWREYDAVLAMYHDQGLIPVKMVAGTSGVNYTTGLTFVRTSPDHGTAEGLAGKHVADASSTIAAMKTAIEVAINRKAAIHE